MAAAAATEATGEAAAEESKEPVKKARPMTAAEIRKQKLLDRKAEMAERKRLNLIKLHEEREAKIEALNAKLAQGLDTNANKQKMKEFSSKMTASAAKKRPQTALWPRKQDPAM